jgi:flagellin
MFDEEGRVMPINPNVLALLSYNAYRAAQADEADEPGVLDEKMRSQLVELIQEFHSVQDAISMLRTADSALHEILSSLQRMRELAVLAANAALTSQSREHIQTEIDKLKEEIDRIAQKMDI